MRALHILLSAGEVGEKTSGLSSLTRWLMVLDVPDTVFNRFGVGEGVLRRERSSGLITFAEDDGDLT